MISFDSISFKFSALEPYFFDNLSITLDEQKLYFLIGQNGSGKSTFFRIARGDIHPGEEASGTTRIGKSSYELSIPKQRTELSHRIGLVSQKYDTMLANQFSFAQNLQFSNIGTYPGLQPLPAIPNLPDLLNRFSIDMHKPVYLLSGGQRQILAILMTLQKTSHLLLLDEPTAALDPINADMVFAFLFQLLQTKKITIMVITHDRQILEKYQQAPALEITKDNNNTRTIRSVEQ